MARLLHLVVFALLSLSALVSAKSVNPISSPTTGDKLTTGEAFLVEWTASNNHTITLTLLKGNSSNLQTVLTIISKLPNTGIVRWTPPTRLYTGYDYTIKIEDDVTKDDNYSNQFTIIGLAPVSSTSTTSSSTSSTTSTTSSSTSTTSSTSSTSSSSSSTSALSSSLSNLNSTSSSLVPVTSSSTSSSPLSSSAWSNSTTSGLTTSTTSSTLETSSSSTDAAAAATTTIKGISGSARLESSNSVILIFTMILGLFALV